MVASRTHSQGAAAPSSLSRDDTPGFVSMQVAVNGQRAKVVDLDYAVRRFAAHAAPPAASAGDSVAERSAEAKAAKEAAKAAEEAAKAERLAAMQARLAAWQAQQAPPQQQQ